MTGGESTAGSSQLVRTPAARSMMLEQQPGQQLLGTTKGINQGLAVRLWAIAMPATAWNRHG